MTLSGAKARFQLNATATPTGVNATGPNVIGQGLGSTSFSDADIIYSFTVTATGSSDVATLTLSTGAIVKTTGTPDVTRWGSQTNDLSAVDFEGVALPAMGNLYGVFIETGDGDSVAVANSEPELPDVTLEPESSIMHLMPQGLGTPGTMGLTFGGTGDTATITIIGKSS